VNVRRHFRGNSDATIPFIHQDDQLTFWLDTHSRRDNDRIGGCVERSERI
jgi:hypothetical protein